MDVYGLGYNIILDEEHVASLVSWLPELQSYGVGWFFCGQRWQNMELLPSSKPTKLIMDNHHFL